MDVEIIYGQIIAKSNHYQAVPSKDGSRRIIKDKAIREYERLFKRQCKIYKDRLIDGMFKLYVTIYYRHNNFDLDNSLKTLLDSLQYCHAITNDNLCFSIEACKKIDKHNPRVVFAIEEYEPKLI